MYRILKIGMDVHSTNYTLCVAEPNLEGDPDILHEVEVEPDYRQILSVITKLRKKYKGDRLEVTCGYEAGCLGYSLYYQLTESGVKCVILAPSTMEMPGGKRIKTDKRDARLIAKCLANGGYSAVHIPSRNDEDIREFLRMREDVKGLQKTVKQRICSFCLRHGHKYCKSKWTEAHMKWLKELPLDDKQRETLTEYLLVYQDLTDRIRRYDSRIDELASSEEYMEPVKKLRCFKGIDTLTALSLVVETGDFKRFAKAGLYASYLGLVPGEASSSTSIKRLPITKAGNSHIRVLLTEAANSISKGRSTTKKSKALLARQKGNDPSVIAYADRANERLRRKYWKMVLRGKEPNVAKTAIARELACFIWGMMTGNVEAAA